MEVKGNVPTFVPLINYQTIEGRIDHIHFLHLQLSLRPRGTTPLSEMPSFSNLSKIHFFEYLTPLEVHAMHIRIVGWKKFIKLLRAESPEPQEDIVLLRKQIKGSIKCPYVSLINRFRWLKIHLPALILNPTNHRHPRLDKNQNEFMLRLPQATFTFIENYQRTGSEDFLREGLKNLQEKQKGYLEIIQTILTPAVCREIEALLEALKASLSYPQELLSFLFDHPMKTPNHLQNRFSGHLSQLLQDLSVVHHYHGQKILEEFKDIKEYILFLNEFEKHLKQAKKLSTVCQNQLRYYQEAEISKKNLFDILKKTVDFAKETQQSLEGHLESRDKILGLLNSLQKSPQSTRLGVLYNGAFNDCDHYLSIACNEILYDNLIIQASLQTAIRKYKSMSSLVPKDCPSSLFSLFDIILIQCRKQSHRITHLVYKQKAPSQNEIQEMTTLFNEIEDQLALLHFIAKTSLVKNFPGDKNPQYVESTLESNINILKENVSALESLRNRITLPCKKEMDHHIHYLGNALDFCEALRSHRSLLLFSTNPLTDDANPRFPISSNERGLMCDLMLQTFEKIEYEYKTYILPVIDERREDLKQKKAVNLSRQFLLFLEDWIKNMHTLSKKISERPFLEQIQLFVHHYDQLKEILHLPIESLEGLSFLILIKMSQVMTCPEPLLKIYGRYCLIGFSDKMKPRKSKRNKKMKQISSSSLVRPLAENPLCLIRSTSLPKFSKESCDQSPLPSLMPSFAKDQRNRPLQEKLASLYHLICTLPQITFQLVSHPPSDQNLLKMTFQSEALLNTKESFEDFLVLFNTTTVQEIGPCSFLFMTIKLTVVAEQILKIHLASIPSKKTSTSLLFTQNTLGQTMNTRHEVGLLYDLLADNILLEEEQANWLRMVDDVIGITGRYPESWRDFLSQKISQMHDLARLEKTPPSKNEAEEWLRNLVGLSAECDALSLNELLNVAKERISKECIQFLELGLETVKSLLLAFVPDLKTSPNRTTFSTEGWSVQLKLICQQIQIPRIASVVSSDDWKNCFAAARNEWTKAESLHVFFSASQARNQLIKHRCLFLNRCKVALQAWETLIMEENRKEKLFQISFLWLQEAVVMENLFYALMSLLPLANREEPDCHLLFRCVKGKLFFHTHRLEACAKILSVHLEGDFPSLAPAFLYLQERAKILEPMLQRLYRYQGKEELETQSLLNQFRFIDQLRYSLLTETLDEEKKQELELIIEAFEPGLKLEDMEAKAQALFDHSILSSSFGTLEHVTSLFKLLEHLLRNEIAEFQENASFARMAGI